MIKTFSKDGIFGFKNSEAKIIFKNPRIQPFDENGFIKNEKSILYYYYDVVGSIIENGKEKIIFETDVFDFPSIINFKYIMEDAMNQKIDSDSWQYDKSSNSKNTYYSYSLNTGGLFVEDYYSITNEIVMEGNSILRNYYNVFVGKSLNCSGSSCIGINFGNVSVDDLKQIYKIVCDFIEYSISEENKTIIERNKTSLNEWFVKDGKLYNIRNDKTQIHDIYTIGMNLDTLAVLVGDIEKKDFSSKDYKKCQIKEINETEIVIKDGYVEVDGKYERIEEEVILLSVLLYIHENMPEDKLKYSEDEITKDFISILSEDEIEEFESQSPEFLFNKWKHAIINRTWMCRKEHNLPERKKEKGNHENVYESVKTIINNIKNSKKC